MKVKEVERTANIAWAPQSQVPIYLAAGTAAQQLDASFCTDSNLEIYGLNLSESGHDMPVVASLPVEQRFHKLVWGAAGQAEGTMPSGLIVGGADRGVISMYDAAKLVKGGGDALVLSVDKHTGPVAALDFNPFQANLLASGGSESEIYIWDVNKLSSPMTPGAKSQPLEEVRSVAWNRQVQHIMASTFSSRCVVWDLRKNDPIIKVSDSTSRSRWKVVAWHPEVATQLCLASEDDHTPVIQIWDLRQASSPMKSLEGHTAGVLSVAWCQADSDLLLSCGKDNRILVWNPNKGAGEIVAELPTSNQWSFEVSWCPRNPAVIASASFDGHVSVHSLMGGQQQAQPSSRVEESFGASIDTGIQQQSGPQVTMQLKAPPKWLRRPCGASFGFGGKLVTVEQVTGSRPTLYMSTVITEPALVQDSAKLEISLSECNYSDYCKAKLLDAGQEPNKSKLWQFLGASFAGESVASEYLDLLGINPKTMREGLRAMLQPVDQDLAGLGLDEKEPLMPGEGGDEFDIIAAQVKTMPDSIPTKPSPLDLPFSLSRDAEPVGQVTTALLAGDMELAVDLCVKQNRYAEALILAIRGGNELLQKTRARYFQQEADSGSCEGLALIEAVSMHSWSRLVENCAVDSWKEALAALLTYTQPGDRESLAGNLADRLSSIGRHSEAMLCYTVAGDMDRVVESWMSVEPGDLAQGKELQQLVEVVVMVRAAVQARGLAAQARPGGKVSEALARYASLLAAQGSLTTALSYLSQVDSTSEELGELKSRLEKSLSPPARTPGQQQPHARAGQDLSRQRQSSFTAPGSRKNSIEPVGHFRNQFGAAQPPNYFQPPESQPAQPTTYMQPSQPQYNSQPPSMYTAPSDPVPSFKPPSDSPVTSRSSNNPLFSGRRTLDASVTAPSGHYQPINQYPGPQQSQYQPPNQYQTPEPVPTQYQQQHTAPTQPGIFNPAEASHMPNPGAPPPVAMMERQPDQPGPGFTPMVSSGYGWNDPPAATVAKNAFSRKSNVTSSLPTEPITTQFFTPEVPPSHPAPSWGGFQPGPASHQPVMNQPQSGASSLITQPYGLTPSYGNEVPPANQPQPPSQAPVQQEPPQPPAPIPAEHQVIQDVLESLRSKCQQAASHPQVRRKLEDVSTKLDILYNKLRSGSLSGPTLQGLHTILQHIWQYDYQSCMQVIAGLIAGGSFAEMSDFMPGVKVLLQVAQQQGVYVEYQQS